MHLLSHIFFSCKCHVLRGTINLFPRRSMLFFHCSTRARALIAQTLLFGNTMTCVGNSILFPTIRLVLSNYSHNHEPMQLFRSSFVRTSLKRVCFGRTPTMGQSGSLSLTLSLSLLLSPNTKMTRRNHDFFKKKYRSLFCLG